MSKLEIKIQDELTKNGINFETQRSQFQFKFIPGRQVVQRLLQSVTFT